MASTMNVLLYDRVHYAKCNTKQTLDKVFACAYILYIRKVTYSSTTNHYRNCTRLCKCNIKEQY